MTKIFCIGFQKTGTKSLARALRMLGYSVTGPNLFVSEKTSRPVHELVTGLGDRFDAFQDNPWPLLYREMDRRYPGSRFILTLRDTDDWMNSVLNHFGASYGPMREWIYGYGSPEGRELVYRSRFEEHNRKVVEYFKGRENQLLIMDLGKGEGWDKLCPFLGKSVPAQPFPQENTARARIQTSGGWANVKNIVRSARQVVGHGRRDLYNISRYGRVAPRKFELIYVNPGRIEHYVPDREIVRLTGRDRNRASGMVVDWSRIQNVLELRDQRKFMLCQSHWREGRSWEELGYYEFMSRTNKWGRRTRFQISKRCDKLDSLFEEVKITRQLKTREQLNPGHFREEGGILVHIGPDGEPVFGGHGFHRLSIAKILDLDSIPACVGVVDRTALDSFEECRRRGVSG